MSIDKIYTNTQYIYQYMKKVIIFGGYAKISIISLGMPDMLGILLGSQSNYVFLG